MNIKLTNSRELICLYSSKAAWYIRRDFMRSILYVALAIVFLGGFALGTYGTYYGGSWNALNYPNNPTATSIYAASNTHGSVFFYRTPFQSMTFVRTSDDYGTTTRVIGTSTPFMTYPSSQYYYPSYYPRVYYRPAAYYGYYR